MTDQVLVDTSAWIEFLRGTGSATADEVRRLVREGRVATCGMVVAELLQGIKAGENADRLTEHLLAMPFLPLDAAGYAAAGTRGADLRRRGITVPLSDLLIAGAAIATGASVLTRDPHFRLVPGLRLHPPEP